MKTKMKKRTTTMKVVLTAVCLYMALPMQVYATTSEPPIVTGTRALLAAGIGILTGIVVAVMTFSAIKVGIKWTNADIEEKPKYQKELIEVIIAGVVTLTIGATITWVVGFYQG